MRALKERVSPKRPVGEPAWERMVGLQGQNHSSQFSAYMGRIDILASEMSPYVEAAKKDPFAVPKDFLRRAGELGLIAPNIPIEDGGMGLSVAETTEAMKRFAYLYPGFALSLFAVAYSLTAQPLLIARKNALEHGDTKRAAELLEVLHRLQTGEDHAFFALTEPNHGSDSGRNLDVKATNSEDSDYIILNGVKSFITNPKGARWGVVTVNVDGIPQTILVDTQESQDGGSLDILGYNRKIGQHGAVLTAFEFNNYRVKKSAILGPWNKVARQTLIVGRNIIAAQAVGIAMREMDIAYKWTNYRNQFKGPLIEIPLIAKILNTGFEQILVCDALLQRSAREYDQENPHASFYASVAKFIASDSAVAIGLLAQQMLAARGYSLEFQVEEGGRNPFEAEEGQTDQAIAQIFLDALATPIYEGPRTLQANVLIEPYAQSQMSELLEMLAPQDGLMKYYKTRQRRPRKSTRLKYVEEFKPLMEATSGSARRQLQSPDVAKSVERFLNKNYRNRRLN